MSADESEGLDEDLGAFDVRDERDAAVDRHSTGHVAVRSEN